jgi:hypothetical protein
VSDLEHQLDDLRETFERHKKTVEQLCFTIERAEEYLELTGHGDLWTAALCWAGGTAVPVKYMPLSTKFKFGGLHASVVFVCPTHVVARTDSGVTIEFWDPALERPNAASWDETFEVIR